MSVRSGQEKEMKLVMRWEKRLVLWCMSCLSVGETRRAVGGIHGSSIAEFLLENMTKARLILIYEYLHKFVRRGSHFTLLGAA